MGRVSDLLGMWAAASLGSRGLKPTLRSIRPLARLEVGEGTASVENQTVHPVFRKLSSRFSASKLLTSNRRGGTLGTFSKSFPISPPVPDHTIQRGL